MLHSASVGLQPHRTRGRHQPHPRRERQHNVDPGARLTRTQEDRNCHFVDFEDLNISELYQELRDELGLTNLLNRKIYKTEAGKQVSHNGDWKLPAAALQRPALKFNNSKSKQRLEGLGRTGFGANKALQ